MTQRPRVSRSLFLTLLAVLATFILSYFPFSEIRAANTATVLPSVGKPLVNLKSPQTPKMTYTGDAVAVAALQGGTAAATALATADFNWDGAMDVAAGYSTGTGGVLVVMHGNPDAFAPTDLTLYAKAAKGVVPPTFLSQASAFSLPESPDLLVTGDFNRDGNPDVLVAARGGNLYLLAGDGSGNLHAPQIVSLAGPVRALAATADGYAAVSIDASNGSQLQILDPAQGLAARATYPLPAQGDSVAFGNLGTGLDLAVGAGSNLVMIYGPLGANPLTETITLPFKAEAIALGDYIWDRDGRTEVAVLGDDGSIHILQHGTLNTTPLKAAEIPGRRAAIMAQRRQQGRTVPNPTAVGAWTIARQLPYTGSAPAGPVSASAFNSPRVASSSTHDLMVVDAGKSQLHILDTSGKTASPSADISFSGTPVAAVALPQTIDSGRDIVVLTSNQAAPALIHTPASLVLNVNTTADIDSGYCTSSNTSIPNPLSLREAVCIANNFAPDTATINLPSGTYSLVGNTDAGTGQLLVETSGTGYSLSIIGAGSGSTTIQQTDNVDRILLGDYAFNGSNPITIENLTLGSGKCTTGNSCSDGGGAVLVGGMPGDDFLATNVVVQSNSAVNYGGGLNSAGSNFTITNSTISNNTVGSGDEGPGGGAYYTDFPPSVEGVVTVTNSSFTNNTSALNGGGLEAEISDGYPITVTGSTFTGNKVTYSGRNGGGIFVDIADSGGTSAVATVSNSRIVGNSAPGGATGIAIEDETTGNLENNWWGCNAGPGSSGCDTVYIEGTGGYTPVLMLSIGATSTQISTNGSTGITATLNNGGTCSGYTGNQCYVPDGTSVAFGGTLGSANPDSGAFSAGKATSTFYAGSGTGAGSATATVDNQTVSVNIDIGTPPQFTSNASTTFTVGTNSSFPVSASGTPSPTVTQTAGTVPSGVTFSSGTGSGTLSGTPAAGTGGVYNLSFQAANGFTPNATQSFTLTVNQAPSITSANSASFTFDTFGSFTVTSAAGTYPTATFNESGALPNGVTLSTSGVLSGTPTQAGSFPITITASNGVSPNATQSFTLKVSQGATSIAVTNVSPTSEVYGQDSTVTITAVLSWTGTGPTPTASDITIGGNGSSGYSATSCGSPSGDTLTCTATYTPTASDTVGTYTESASFSGDSNYTGSSSTQSNNFGITQATSSTSVGSSQNPSLVGQQVTFTATIDGQYGMVVKRNGVVISGGLNKRSRISQKQAVHSDAPAFSGTVTWSSNTGCSPSTVSGDPGTAQCTTTTLPQGTDTITATYSGDTNHSGSTGTLSGGQVVNPSVTPTSIAVTNVSPPSEVYGQDATVTITAVLSWTGTGPTPTASDITIGGNGPSGYSATSCGSPSGDTLTCTATYTPAASDTVGTYTESASFSGDSNYTGSSSTQTNNFSITQATSSTSVSSSQNPSLVGQQVTFTATIDGQYGMVVKRNGVVISGAVSKRGMTGLAQKQSSLHPVSATGFGGTVTWSSNTGCSPSTVSGNPGTAQCTTTTLPQGTDTITATYSGDTNHSGSTGTLSGGQVVNPSVTPTSIAVTDVSPTSEVYGQDSTVTITAVLSWTGTGPTPTASDITIGGNGSSGYSATSCGSPSGDTLTCTATYAPTASDTVGTYTESASFSGDSNYTGSSSTQSNNFGITQATSSTSVGSGQNPSVVGQPVTFTATIDGQYGLVLRRNGTVISSGALSKRGSAQKLSSSLHPVPVSGLGGTVTWSSNTGCSPSTVSGDPGTAQCTTTTLPQGTDTITATYSGDSNHSGSTGTLSGGQQVNEASTMTSLMSSKNPSETGQDVVFTATVSSSGPTPTGTVKFLKGSTLLGSAMLSGGVATFSKTNLPAGTNVITAMYEGDSSNSGSTSSPLDQVVLEKTVTSLSSLENPAVVNQPITVTATVSSSNGPPPNGEKVTFICGAETLGTGTLTNGSASITFSKSVPGIDSIVARYAGDSNFAPSSGSLIEVVTPAPTTTTLSSSVNPSNSGQAVVFTITVTPEYPGTTPQGSVVLVQGSAKLGEWPLSNGTVNATISTLSVGKHTLTAKYTGGVRFLPSTSAPLVQTVK